MTAALNAVESGTGVNKVEREHGIPATTTSSRVKHGTNPGPRAFLNAEEETELGTFF